VINIERELKEFQAVKNRRLPWEHVWEYIARYVLMRKQGFGVAPTQPEFYLHGDVFNDTPSLALGQMVSSIAGALWKGAGRTVRIVKPKIVPNSTEIKEYYTEINRRFAEQVDHPKAKFVTAHQEYLTENCAFGTSGLGVFPARPGSGHLIDYKATGLKHLWVQEDALGNVVKIFYETHLNAPQLIDEYGDAAQIDEVQAAIESMDFNTLFAVVWIIRPRKKFNPKKKNNQNMPFETIHILQKPQKVLRESGVADLPIKVTRFLKNEGEEYGRSAPMSALATIVTLNAFWELLTKGGEKSMDPALWMLDDGSFGGGLIDRSPGAVNILDSTSRITSGAPIGTLNDVGDPSWVMKVIENLEKQVFSHFLVDRLLDLNNQTRMTLGEAQIRNELRSDSTGSVFSRQIEENLVPTMQRSIQILVDAGEFGVVKGSYEEDLVRASGRIPLYVPAELIELDKQGVEIYNIEFTSPAMRILRSEELRGIMSAWQFSAGFSAQAPELMLRLDKKKSQDLIVELTGSSPDILLSDEAFAKEMAAFQEAQAQQMQMAMEKNSAEVEAKRGSAAQQHAQAQATQMGASGMMNGGGMVI
jgi:hypothetical protein